MPVSTGCLTWVFCRYFIYAFKMKLMEKLITNIVKINTSVFFQFIFRCSFRYTERRITLVMQPLVGLEPASTAFVTYSTITLQVQTLFYLQYGIKKSLKCCAVL